MEKEENLGIYIEIESYRVIRLDTSNIAIQIKKKKQSGDEFYDTLGYYSSEEAAFRKLFNLVTRDVNKRAIGDCINAYIKCSDEIVRALKST